MSLTDSWRIWRYAKIKKSFACVTEQERCYLRQSFNAWATPANGLRRITLKTKPDSSTLRNEIRLATTHAMANV